MQSRSEQADAFESAFSHFNVEDVQRPIPPPVLEITPHIVLPGQYGDCQQAVSNQHICDICRSHVNFFVVYQLAHQDITRRDTVNLGRQQLLETTWLFKTNGPRFNTVY